ncbi:hypothetical protein Bpfe_021477 [Biomphalaria pfeifferi]|uniref:Uncharacterized protein n=1 Tax=Biomphalaria pfeifferi TaxID=112525 RepID=A0AAD8B6W7_BIOPF|nr:hypothetical protein Bpfe_021477 [Biomphalaria pfeifferi]
MYLPVKEQMNSFQVQLGTKLEEVNEQVCTMIKQIGTSTSLNKTNETFATVMNKTDDQMATISRGINNPLLNADVVDGGAVYDCDSESCKLGSYDKNPEICCDSAEHRFDQVNVIPACTQAFNKNCLLGAYGASRKSAGKTCTSSSVADHCHVIKCSATSHEAAIGDD